MLAYSYQIYDRRLLINSKKRENGAGLAGPFAKQ